MNFLEAVVARSVTVWQTPGLNVAKEKERGC